MLSVNERVLFVSARFPLDLRVATLEVASYEAMVIVATASSLVVPHVIGRDSDRVLGASIRKLYPIAVVEARASGVGDRELLVVSV